MLRLYSEKAIPLQSTKEILKGKKEVSEQRIGITDLLIRNHSTFNCTRKNWMVSDG